MTTTSTYTFHVHGMHCNACVLTIESELGKSPSVSSATAKLGSNTVTVTGDFGGQSPEQIAQSLTPAIQSFGYSLSLERQKTATSWSDFWIALPIALGFALLFVLLQKIGLVRLVGDGTVTYGTAFVIGIIASLSTCMAVVGGLLLSMSATFSKEGKDGKGGAGENIRPQLLFHGGRIVSFFVLGGVIGAIGSAFALSTTATFVLGLVIGLVMLVLGINLLDLFPWAKKLQFAMPKRIGQRAHGISKFSHTLTPLLVGIATFFLPCGFTQSMQLYTLSTGTFMRGGLTMLAFALGTLPVLLLISFSSFNIQKSRNAGVFFKTAGLIVILFALFNLLNSLVVAGILPPLFNF